MLNNILYIVRGLPGSGKSTFAKSLNCPVYEADMFFIDNETGEYNFDISKIKLAHSWCKESVENAMRNNLEKIVVSNTFTQEWEMQDYFNLAKKYNYTTFVVIIENRHDGKNIHNVSDEKLLKMKERFEIKL